MFRGRYRSFGVLLCVAFLLPSAATPQERIEDLRKAPLAEVRLPQGLQTHTKAYTIQQEVLLVNRFYQFTIDSPHALYRIFGLRELVRTIHEIRVIEAARPLLDSLLGLGQGKKGGGGNLAKKIVVKAAGAIAHALETSKEIGKGIGRGVSKLGRKLKVSGGGEKEDGEAAAVLSSLRAAPGSSAFRARTAASLTVENDSSNPYVQRLIDDAVRAYQAKKLTFSAGFLLAPVEANLPAVPVLEGSSYTLPPHANVENPSQARAEVERDLIGFGMTPEFVRDLLANPGYIAPYLLRLRDVLDTLSNLEGLQLRLQGLPNLPNRATVLLELEALELIRSEHLARGSIYEIHRGVRTPHGILVVDFVREREEGVMVEVADLGPKDARFIRTISRLAAAQRSGALQKVAVWCTCALTREARAYSKRQGVTVHEQVTPSRIKSGL